MKERTLVLIKPEGVKKHLTGKIVSRFEDAGLKIVGMKQVWVDKEFAKKHYTEDIAERNGERIRENLLNYIVEGPVVAIALEGINAIENVRKMVGGTEPKSAPPGTIRGDFSHVSYQYADANDIPVKNIVHASGDEQDAKHELPLWFSDNEIHSYETVTDYF
ncbi:MAG: nucleoside-diphosphate kinase [Candidatus Pacearchaeota archaeon]